MKFLIKFSSEIGLQQLCKELSANQTIQNLQILISLNYEKMSQCKLTYQGKSLTNKNQFLRDIFTTESINQITVEKKSELEQYAIKAQSMNQLVQKYPIYAAAAVVGLLFLVMYLMGG